MKNNIIVIALILSGCYPIKTIAQPAPINDTLQWLKINIEQQSSYYSGKPLKVLLDTLNYYGLKSKIHNYLRMPISDDAPANTYPGDTVRTDKFTLYFYDVFDGGVIDQLHDTNPSINTHVPRIFLTFTQRIPFPTNFNSYPIRSRAWTTAIENLCKTYIIQSVSVGEY